MTTLKMSLSGNLGERHRSFNTLVNDAYQKNMRLHAIPEDSGIERLFKIDLASKQRNIDYILHTLKDDDMLYVSRALKCLWLFEPQHWQIINPIFLENDLFTHMRLQAVNKMRHWIQTHLRDPIRCSEFYLFYKDKDFQIAAKFLWHCSSEYILCEFNNVLDKITPKHLKLLSEVVPKVTQVYFESLKVNLTALKYYLDNDHEFFANVKFLLKPDPDVFFYVIENFFVFEKFSAFSSDVTKFILRHHKSRFIAKPELYSVWLFNMKALAQCLNPEEVKDLVIKLAKAEFLGSWFSYKSVEPLVKRLSKEERTAFKKLVFVDKAFGPTVKEWPYPVPVPFPPELTVPQIALFVDREIKIPVRMPCQMLCSRSAGGGFAGNFKTLLDQLFDQYRFTSFEQTLVELRKRLRSESSPRNRQHMLLVLISKTGGRTEALTTLLELLLQFKNEPAQVRAAIVRSLVKRAFIWRLPPEQWAILLKWGHGLGLDGNLPEAPSSEYSDADIEMLLTGMGRPVPKRGKRNLAPDLSEAPCIEGLHAVIIRDLLSNTRPEDVIWNAFMNNFSPLAEYALSSSERNYISARLPMWLLAEAQSHPEVALNRLHLLLDTLFAYSIRFDNFPGILDAIMATARSDFGSAKSLLNRLYKAGVGRKHLIKEYFEIIQTDASYVNALRHNTSILENTERFGQLMVLNHERFLQKLALFFSEEDGLGERYRTALKRRATTTPDKKLARHLALLAGSTFPLLLKDFDSGPSKTLQRQFSAALRSNMHVVRPPFNLESLGWRKAGQKATANVVATCRHEDLDKHIAETLSWSRTLRLAVKLAKRANKEHEAYEVFASKRPGAALKAALKYFKCEGNKLDIRIWNSVKHHIGNLDHEQCRYFVTNVIYVPAAIKADYCALVYKACKLSSREAALPLLYHISPVLHEVDDQFIVEEIEDYLNEEFTQKNIYSKAYLLYVDIVAKYLLLSTSEVMFEERFRRIGIPFFKHIEFLWNKLGDNTLGNIISQLEFSNSLVLSLKYNKAFYDTKYTSCSNVLEKFTELIHSFMAKEKCFAHYVEVHLVMIYLKSIRYCLNQSPELFSDESKKNNEGVCELGNIFGTFIVNEIEEMTRKYFTTVVVFYVEKISSFLNNCYSLSAAHDKTVDNFARAMLKGILSDKESVSGYILASNVYKKFSSKCNDDKIKGILKSFQESGNKELRFRARVDVDECDVLSRGDRAGPYPGMFMNFPQRPPSFLAPRVRRRPRR